LIFARHQNLDNLTFIVDANGLQGFGSTREVADLAPLGEKFRVFGVPTVEVDGHDAGALVGAMKQRHAGPGAVVAKTRKGCGVSFMENQMQWHYLPMSESEYARAVREVSESGCCAEAKRPAEAKYPAA
jgi:transketolase